MSLKPDHFEDKAREWDTGNTRVQNAQAISTGIRNQILLTGKEHIMDFGAGTGLLSEGISRFVNKITAIDYSQAMLAEFAKKNWSCETETLKIDLSEADLHYRFDGIISSMTLHHIKDVPNIIKKFHDLLMPGGFIAIGDLEKEDGTFHQNNSGVEHFGFNIEYLRGTLKKAGFHSITGDRINTIQKEVEGTIKEFPVFLVTARK